MCRSCAKLESFNNDRYMKEDIKRKKRVDLKRRSDEFVLEFHQIVNQ